MIKYRSGYKHQLAEDASVRTNIRPAENIRTEFIDLDTGGFLAIRNAYAWDGPTGVRFFVLKLMTPSLFHDALCQLLRMDLLPPHCRVLADDLYRQMSLENGVWSVRAWWQYRAVRLAKGASDPRNRKKIRSAP